MADFFRFPHTPHLVWLGQGIPRDDKVLSPEEAEELLAAEVVVEEKIDGANLGISIGPEGEVRVQNRGQYLHLPMHGQFEKLQGWLKPRVDEFFDLLGSELILFGEWCAARHSISYDRLPNWYVIFDVYDRQAGLFWDTRRRNKLAVKLSLPVVPQLLCGRMGVESLGELIHNQPSQFYQGPLEGIVIRRESGGFLKNRVKLVHPAFVQAIGEHWSRRRIEENKCAGYSTNNTAHFR
jgi:ATP-dependent RNA circularization protein (DNA/RNA ligase family)